MRIRAGLCLESTESFVGPGEEEINSMKQGPSPPSHCSLRSPLPLPWRVNRPRTRHQLWFIQVNLGLFLTRRTECQFLPFLCLNVGNVNLLLGPEGTGTKQLSEQALPQSHSGICFPVATGPAMPTRPRCAPIFSVPSCTQQEPLARSPRHGNAVSNASSRRRQSKENQTVK